MKYKNFGDYVESLSQFDQHVALTTRPFLKIERLSYQDLQMRAYQTAHYLTKQGIGVGDRVMVVASNSPSWLQLMLGTQLIGAILVPVDATASLKVIQHFIEETQPKAIFKNQQIYPELTSHSTTYSLDELDKSIAEYPHQPPKKQPDGERAALIVFTSGTTADPKGVLLTQNNILSNISGIQKVIDINPNWRLLSVLPLSHMYELTGSLTVLSRGASIYYMPRVTPAAIAEALQNYQITTILAIPQLLILLLERIRQTAAEEGKAKVLTRGLKLAAILPFPTRRLLFGSVHSRLGGHLDLVVTGGAPIPVEVASSWERMGVKMVQGYGLTETSPILTVNRLNKRQLNSPGFALNNVRLRIAENDEIQADGPNVFSEYWHNPSASKAAFTEDGWFRTGDTGRLQDGWLYIQGRLKFAIVRSSGLKVFPEDIELVAANHPTLKAFCVVGVKYSGDEKVVAVLISDKSDQAVSQAITEINNQLESFQHIDEWRRWPDSDFPRTRLLKIDRRQVQTWANLDNDSQPPKRAEEKPQEDSIKRILRLSLDEPSASIGETDRLADIGLDSLRRLNILALIEGQLGITIPEEEITGSTTVSTLRKLVDSGSRVEPPDHRPTWPYNRWLRLIGNGVRQAVIQPIVRIWVKTNVEGIENLDNLKTPAIFIFNHSDDFDGPVIYQALPRRIRKRLSVAVADDVMREHKLLEFAARLCFAGFNLNRREPYMPSLEYVGQMIDRGWNVVISPEGRISPSGKLQPFKSGIGLLAVSLGVPIVPMKTIGLRGTVPLHAKWPKRRSKVRVRIGQPITFDPGMSYEDVTQTLHETMERL